MIAENSTSILFYYPVATLLDKLKMHSGMVARMNPDQIEKYAVTDDELTWFHAETNKNIRIIFGKFHKLGTSSPLILNEPATVGATDNRYGFYITNNTGININSLQVLDSLIENLLVEMLLREWWLKVGLADHYKVSSSVSITLNNSVENMLYTVYKSAASNNVTYAVSSVSYDSETQTETNN